MVRSVVRVLALAVILVLAGCGFFQSKVDQTDPRQALLYSGVRTAAFAGCMVAGDQHPDESAIAAQAIDQTVVPLLAGGTANTTAIRTALMGAVSFDPRILAQAFTEVDELLKLVPAVDRDQVYAEALTQLVTSCRNGLAPPNPTAFERFQRWLGGTALEAVG